jgi:putative tryptophan/tyrosine transport system substrate-binding protein
MPVIGYLDPGTPQGRADLTAAFRKGLGEIGYIEGGNVAIEYRWAENRLHQAVPQAATIGFLVNPTNPTSAQYSTKEIEVAAGALGLKLLIVNASTERELAPGFASLAQQSAGAVLLDNDFLFFGSHELPALAAQYAIPVMYPDRDLVAAAGGLMSYAASLADSYRQAGVYVGRILKREKPADLPVLQPTKFELVINLKTAKALGLTVPPTLLATADEVIE